MSKRQIYVCGTNLNKCLFLSRFPAEHAAHCIKRFINFQVKFGFTGVLFFKIKINRFDVYVARKETRSEGFVKV